MAGAAKIFMLLCLGLLLGACVEGKERPLDGSSSNTFDLKITVQVIQGTTLTCSSTDEKADCVGNLYWALFDKPVTTIGLNPPLRAGTLKGAKNGSAAGIPVKPQIYLGAFLDDNNNMVITTPLPDKGDPIYSSPGFTVKSGGTYSQTIALMLRMW